MFAPAIDIAKRAYDSFNKCSTSFLFKHNCEGCESKCPYCGEKFCEYHLDAVGNAITDLQGGHVCPKKSKGGALVQGAYDATCAGVKVGAVVGAVVATGGTAGVAMVATVGSVAAIAIKNDCSTHQMTKINCKGESKACQHCRAVYCAYHYDAVTTVMTVASGHVCSEKTKWSKVGDVVGLTADVALLCNTANGAAGSVGSTMGASGAVGTMWHGGKAVAGAYSSTTGTIDSAKKIQKL